MLTIDSFDICKEYILVSTVVTIDSNDINLSQKQLSVFIYKGPMTTMIHFDICVPL